MTVTTSRDGYSDDGRRTHRHSVDECLSADHDVEIAALDVPRSGRQGQQRTVTVDVTNSRYTESVEVTLFKSTVSGEFVPIGTDSRRVGTRGSEKATSFSFTYVFTEMDAQATKLTFRAVATIVGFRDTLPPTTRSSHPPCEYGSRRNRLGSPTDRPAAGRSGGTLSGIGHQRTHRTGDRGRGQSPVAWWGFGGPPVGEPSA